MNKPLVRERYINLHGDNRHFIEMVEKRDKEFIERVAEKGVSEKDARLMLEECDRLDEELGID